MSQKKSIWLSVAACGLILLLLIGLGKLMNEETTAVYASDYGQLQLHINYSTGTEAIEIWQAEDGRYYFFLPSGVENCKVSFGNLKKGDSIRIGEEEFSPGEPILRDVAFGTKSNMQLCIDGNQMQEQQVTFLKSENLSALFLETETGSTETIHADKNAKEQAVLTIVDKQGNVETRAAMEYIKTRGNSTFAGFEKKSYQIKFFNKKSVLGMAKAKKWVLLANAQDDSLIRNKLINDFAEEYTFVPVTDGVYADVYMNSQYLGNYYICEKIEVDDGRLSLTDLEEQNVSINTEDDLENGAQYVSEDGKIRAVSGLNNPQDITGGYLLEKIIASEYEECRSAFITNSGICYRVVSPQNATIAQVEYICGLWNEAELALSQPNGIHPETGKHFSDYLDMDSWTSKYLMEEVFMDPDAPAASMFFYKDSDAIDSKIYSGPMWDYDRAIGGYGVHLYHIDDPMQIGYRGVYAGQLLQHDEVVEMVLDKYREYFLPYLNNKLPGKVNELQRQLEASATMNRIRWPKLQGYYAEWEANGDYLVSFLEKRADYLNDLWLENQQYHTVSFLDYNGNVCAQYEIKHGEYLTETPDVSAMVAVFGGWYSTATGKNFDTRLPILEDVTYASRWVDVSVLVQNGLGAAELKVANVDIETLEKIVEELKKMQEENP